jgi:hypothetical protein
MRRSVSAIGAPGMNRRTDDPLPTMEEAMPRPIALLLALATVVGASTLTTALADEQQRLLGTWKVVSFFTEDVETKARNNVYGERPRGLINFAPDGRFYAVVTADGRNVPKTADDQAAAFRTMIAYSGKYRLDGNKFISKVDVAWNEAWVGTEQMRFWRLDGRTLHIQSAPIPNPNDATKKVIGILIFERE